MRTLLVMTAALMVTLSLASGPASPQGQCSSQQCESQCGQVLGPPNAQGLRGLEIDQACVDRCSQQAAACRAKIDAQQRARKQQELDQRRRAAEEEEARKQKAAAEKRRIFEEEARKQRENAAERAKLNKAAEDDLRRRQKRDADIQKQQSIQNAQAGCRRQCGNFESSCLGHNPASDNVQLCQRQGNECRSNCNNPAFIPKKSFTFISRPNKTKWGHRQRDSAKILHYWDYGSNRWRE